MCEISEILTAGEEHPACWPVSLLADHIGFLMALILAEDGSDDPDAFVEFLEDVARMQTALARLVDRPEAPARI